MKSEKEMAEHVRAAVENLNGVLKEAQKVDLKVDLTMHILDGYTGSVNVKCIKLIRSL